LETGRTPSGEGKIPVYETKIIEGSVFVK